jgi:zinc transport system ATP-binding protein
MQVVGLTGVSFAYGRGAPVLSDVDLDIASGELVAIAGPNGGGKTSLIRLIVGLERPSAGRVELFGEPVRPGTGDRRIGYLPQRAEAGLSSPITVRELVAVGRAPARGIFRSLDNSDEGAIATAIERVGLEELAEWPLAKLSGGQQQRAFIGKALAGDPRLLILDEPSTGVDVQAQGALAGLVDELRRDLEMTILFVSHEFGAIEPYARRLLIVRGGIEFDGPPDELAARLHDPSHLHA